MFLLIVQFITVGVLFAVASLIFELPVRGINGYALNTEQLLKIGYLTVACTLFAQSAQMIGQKFTKPNQSAIILSLEAVFGMLFSVIVGAEKLSTLLCVGFTIVFIAIIISELKLDTVGLLKRKRKNLASLTEKNQQS